MGVCRRGTAVALQICFYSRLSNSQNPETGKITDFFSFYSLPSTVIGNAANPTLEAAYLFYYATDTGLRGGNDHDQIIKNRLTALIGDAVITANNAGFDVFNALTLMDNMPILPELKVSQRQSALF